MAALTAFAGRFPAETEQVFPYTVKKGESISLICIDFYGHYTNGMGKTILSENPSLKDINVIFPGQALKLHNPNYKATPAETAKDPAAALFEQKVTATQGVVTFVEGEAQLIAKGSTVKQKCAVNTIVAPGDVIKTSATGRVEIIINRETVVRVRENTRLVVEAFRNAEANSGKTQMGFSVGSVWAKIKKFKDKTSRFELELPTAIAGVHGTVYQATISKDSSSEVKVFNGEVAVANNPANKAAAQAPKSMEAGEVGGPDEIGGPTEVSMDEWVSIVKDMQKIRIDKKGNPKKVEPFSRNAEDSWEKWNSERDKRIAEMFGETEQ